MVILALSPLTRLDISTYILLISSILWLKLVFLGALCPLMLLFVRGFLLRFSYILLLFLRPILLVLVFCLSSCKVLSFSPTRVPIVWVACYMLVLNIKVFTLQPTLNFYYLTFLTRFLDFYALDLVKICSESCWLSFFDFLVDICWASQKKESF